MKGIGVSPGISIGKAFIINKAEVITSGITLVTQEDKHLEIEKFDKAVLGAVEEVEAIREKKVLSHSREEIDILDTQIEFLNDPQIRSRCS